MKRYWRKVIRIKAEDSPNVRLALAEQSKGMPISHTELVPGVKSYRDYVKHREIWDPVLQCIGLDADFYEGAELLLFPPENLNLAEELATKQGKINPISMGVDSAEGGDNTCWCVSGYDGLVDLVSMRTPNTDLIYRTTLSLMQKHHLDPDKVLFDRGGGGKQHADRLRNSGYPVRTIAFGEAVKKERTRGITTFDEHKKHDEEAYICKNMRAMLYCVAAQLLEPELTADRDGNVTGTRAKFSLNRKFRTYADLRKQLSVMPKWFDGEGRLYLPPKDHKPDSKEGRKIFTGQGAASGEKTTLRQILGGSPDEADAFVLSTYGLVARRTKRSAGAVRVGIG